ncbi:MAG TPA: YhjD/YihY/BrkB family envelope integrity protein [Actinomycetota bacterium]|nr:YhjD/YihY/BrkB family envelope integrity protein [Actinomycetota bacterium]
MDTQPPVREEPPTEPEQPQTEPPSAGPDRPADLGRVARARRSAQELEERARGEFDRAREQHLSVRLAVEAFESDRARAGGLLAGGLAYRVFLWQIPLALFLLSAFGLVAQLADEQPSDLARRAGMTAALAGAIAKGVSVSDSSRWWLLIVGAFLTVWAGRGVYRGVRLVSELAWNERGRPVGALKASLLVTGFGLLLVSLQLFLPKLTESLGLPTILRFALGLVLATALSLGMLRLLPRNGAGWIALLPGAVLFGVGMRGLGLAAATYFAYRLDHSGDLYGAIGIAIVMMLYLFVVARVFVAAQFLNATFYRRRLRSTTTDAGGDHDASSGASRPSAGG